MFFICKTILKNKKPNESNQINSKERIITAMHVSNQANIEISEKTNKTNNNNNDHIERAENATMNDDVLRSSQRTQRPTKGCAQHHSSPSDFYFYFYLKEGIPSFL
jgi:hypothetical protein